MNNSLNDKVRLSVTSQGRTCEIMADMGENLLSVLRRNGVFTENCCGGRGTCGKCRVVLDGEDVLACGVVIEKDCTVIQQGGTPIFSENGIARCGVLYGEPAFALDIGTTTVALALTDLSKKAVVDVFTADNPQRAYGADIMSRIGHCAQGGLAELNKCLIDCINALLKTACDKYSITGANQLYVAGNTTMLHLFFSVDCSAMGAAPYTPSFLDCQRRKGEDMGIIYCSEVLSLPCISSFVGADITAGIATLENSHQSRYSILLDLGTNAEIALFKEDKVLCTAAAAGPCFEGANISCGMSATDGAIKKISSESGKAVIETIGNKAAKGICGTGLVDAMAFLLKSGEIDETGHMENGDYYAFTDDVCITQGDVRAFQTAKSAVFSGIEILMKTAGITADDVEALYLAGGFSCFIDTCNAAYCGLFPKALAEKCISVANSSLKGTISQLFSFTDCNAVPLKSEFVDLASNADFSMAFMENIMFE